MSVDDEIRRTYFPLSRPCSSCPFLRASGHTFGLDEDRLQEIANSHSFVCHKTTTKGVKRQKTDPAYQEKPTIQCKGLISVLSKTRRGTVIMRLAQSMEISDFKNPDPKNECYSSIEEAITAHKTGKPPQPADTDSNQSPELKRNQT